MNPLTVSLCRRVAPGPTIKRPVGKKVLAGGLQNFTQQLADYGQTVTDHYFAGGLWTAGFRALPDLRLL
jgi:hypothetical protein